MTKSELVFEEFCSSRCIPFARVAQSENQGEKRPDYVLNISPISVVVEVKEFQQDPEEKDLLRRLRAGEPAGALVGKVGHKVPQAITKAGPQLKSLSKGLLPTLLLIDNDFDQDFLGVANPTHSYNMLTGMYGLEAETLAVPSNPQESVQWLGRKIGGKRKMTPVYNTSISAIASLPANRSKGLSVFHNVFAKPKLDPRILYYPDIRHFTLPTADDGYRFGWERIEL